MSGLTKDDLVVHQGNARISDRRLMEVLGYKELGKIRTLIDRNKEELNAYGRIIAQTEVLIGRGRPKLTNLLTEEHALLLCMFARTARAAEARSQIVKVFMAYRNGDHYTLAQETQKPDIFAQAADRTGHVARHLNNIQDMNGLIASLTHLPIWKNGRRPKWWGNIEVRTYLTMAHREVRITDAADYCNRTFGEGTVGKTAIGEYWLRLDKVLMPTNLHGETVRALKQIGHATQSKSEASR